MEAKEIHRIPASPGISQKNRRISSYRYETCTFCEFISLTNFCLTYKKLMIIPSCSGEGPPARIVIFHPVCSMSDAPIAARDWGSLVIELITKVSAFTLGHFLKTLMTGNLRF